MLIVDFYPSQGSYSPGQRVIFLIELESFASQNVTLQIVIGHLGKEISHIEQSPQLGSGTQTIEMQWTPPAKPAGYSARMEIQAAGAAQPLEAVTAFDVLEDWTQFPRYGFLTDFSASSADPELALKKLTRFHINGLQFYDWQYRHDQLLAPTENYVDPLGREMSLAAVRSLVGAAHTHGMAAMPYLAIYAASAEFWRAHPAWALYDENGTPIAFGENFLGLMDPSAGGSWSEHLLAEGTRTLKGIPFDGLHIDQYGDPKQAWDSNHHPVDLPRSFVEFIQSASDRHPDKTILFNAVGNWPIEALAESAVDFVYIEVWPPDVEYRHLAKIVLDAVHLSHGRSVVIALYLPAGRPANNLLADAVILACGGTRIELGEDARLLSDPYFPKHEAISPDLNSQLRQLADFTVRNGEWMRPYALSSDETAIWADAELNPDFIATHDFLWTVIRRYPGSMVIQLVNFNGLDPHQRWDETHAAPVPSQNINVKIHLQQCPSQVVWDSPEQTRGPLSLGFEYSSGTLTFPIPQIKFIGLVAIYE